MVGNHVGAPVLEILDPADHDARVVDVDPVVREHLRPIDHQRHADEVAVGKGARRLTHRVRRGRIEQADQLADRDGGDEVRGNVLLDPAFRIARQHRAGTAAAVLDAQDRAPVQHGPAALSHHFRHAFPHLAGAESWVTEPVDQGRDQVAAPAWPAARQQRAAHSSPEVEAFDSLGGPICRQLLGADAPDLFRVGLEEDVVQTPAELVPDPVFQAAWIPDRRDARVGVAGHAPHRLDRT